MAEKGFGVKEINLIGASGTPTIESPNNLNLNAVNVAISTNVSIGGTLAVTGNVSIGGTLTYEDVTNIDSVGLITARSGLIVSGVSTFTDIQVAEKITHVGDDNTDISFGTDSINLRVGGNSKLNTSTAGVLVYGTILRPNDDNQVYLGTGVGPQARWAQVHAVEYYGGGSNLTGIAVTEAPVTDYTVTASGSSAYRFHGGGVNETADNPDLYLIRGQKYRFNNTTGSGHPFKIRGFADGSGGTNYTDGVTGDDEGVQFFTVPYTAPSKIFYQCELHAGMRGNVYIRGAGGQNTNVGVTTFDVGAPGSSNKIISSFQSESSRRLDIVWHDSGSLMGFDTPGNHSYIFKVNGTERARFTGTDATISGATDGVLNLTTTDSRGSFIRFQESGTSKCFVGCGQGLSLGDQDDLGLRATDKVRLWSNGAQRLVIDSNKVMHGDSNVLAGGLDDVRIRNSASYRGLVLRGTGGSGGMANYNEYCFLFNRMGSDGDIITFNAQGSQEGSISVSGSSVSYNGGVLSRWSQLVGISTNNKADRPTIYQGTVMSNLDEMCEWPGEENMQLNKTEVSTASGDKNVAGVFWAWHDDDDVYTNDFYVAQTGDYIIRVGAATTVTRGDLLESAGDGTAKPQSDDIVRSKTVAKVTSGIAHTTYPDGTKTYPCVLMGS